jgi:hypothetical protein
VSEPKKGSFKDLFGCALGTLTTCLGETVTYKPCRGGSVEIEAVFDRTYVSVDPETEQVISTNEPMLGVRLSDLPFKPQKNDRVLICGETFKVIDSQEDGQGGASLLMHRVKLLDRA